MADYCSLVRDCIDDVQVKVRGRDGVLLNKHQCGYLAQELLKVSESLRARGAKSLKRGMQRTVILHLHATVKRAQVLVTRCCCGSSSRLAAAMALGDTKEEVVAILLGLHQWSFLLDVAMISGPGSALQSAEVQELLETGEESYQRLSKQQSKMQIAVHDAARQDREELLERVAKHSSVAEEARHDEDFIRGVYLKAQLTHTEPGILQIVERLKAHTLVDSLGSGASGMVMKVKWWGQEVALKILKVIGSTEATLLGQVEHPNIVRLFHYWEEQSPTPHSRILMELMPGDLQQHIVNALGKRSASPRPSEKEASTDGMPFLLPVAIDTMLQVAQAMRHVHEKKLTHRDLKTSNILVKPLTKEYLELHIEGYLEVKLADFGSSKAYTNCSISGDLTRNIGTTAYGAPEIFGKEQIARERNYPPKADVWSFGMTCSEILTGKVPFADVTARSTLHKRIVRNGLRPSLPRDCPEYVQFCIASCWELQPQRRPSFRDLCRMLKHAKLLSLGLMDVESSKWLFAYQTAAGALKALQPQDDSRISRFGLERIWRNLFGAEVSSTARNSSTIGNTSTARDSSTSGNTSTARDSSTSGNTCIARNSSTIGLCGPSQAVQSLSMKLFKLTNNMKTAFDLKPNSRLFSFEVLRAATRDFHSDMRLGQDDNGTIYKGVLPSGNIVAVKLLRRPLSLIMDEVVAKITEMNHRNLVNLKGYCFHGFQGLLVYEYVDNLDVCHIILDRGLSEGQDVSWSKRMNICLGVARGLHHLHKLAAPEKSCKLSSRMDGDITARNILLDHNLEPKISNFWSALCWPDLVLHKKTAVEGTSFYVAPESRKAGNDGAEKVSEIVDVYSFGVLCLEIISGRCYCDRHLDLHTASFYDRALHLYNKGKLIDTTDSRRDSSGEKVVLRLIHISFLCLRSNPEQRPTMSEVVRMLQGDIDPQVTSPL